MSMDPGMIYAVSNASVGIPPLSDSLAHAAASLHASRAILYSTVCLLLPVITLSRVKSQHNRRVVSEPLVASPTIPLFGHLYGLLRNPLGYPTQLMKSSSMLSREPMFTIPIGGKQIHIVSSPELSQVALRHQNFSFDPWVRSFCGTVLRCSPKTLELLQPRHHMEMEGYNRELYQSIHQNLKKGPALLSMNEMAMKRVSIHLNSIGVEDEPRGLLPWVQDFLADAISTALYGSDNPLTHDSHMRSQFWEYEAHLTELLITPLPGLFFRGANTARKALQAAFQEYFSKENPDASALIRQRFGVDVKWGVGLRDSASLVGVALLAAALGNTHALLFWLIVYVFRDADLVDALRAELEPWVREDGNTFTFDVAGLEDPSSCPLLGRVYSETLRMAALPSSVREVVHDTILTYKPNNLSSETRDFFIRKGSMIQIPASISHRSSVWEQPEVFNPNNFAEKSRSSLHEKIEKQSFHPFGGGKHLCPGRFLTYRLLLSTIATLVLGFEISAVDGGSLRTPESFGDPTAAVLKPTKAEKDNYKINIRKRDGKWRNAIWKQHLGTE
ncbi:cytochrome P450 [Xylariales sp. PMI_506]|nr:cytochrome P450 [Xylariales sp. PMI_506]